MEALLDDAPGVLRLESFFVDSGSLPSPPVTLLEVIRTADEPDILITDLGKLIELDVALSVQLIRMSNSSLYSPVNEITSIERAISTLGLRSVRLLALATSLKMLLPAQDAAFSTTEIRRRMVVNGSLSRVAAGLLSRQLADEAFTCGLLSGVGRVVLATKAPESCNAAVEQFGGWPTLADEGDFFGFTSDDITTELIRSWGLPQSLCSAIQDRSRPPSEDDGVLVKSLRFGLAAEEVLCGPETGGSLETLLNLAEADLGLSEQETQELVIASQLLVDETADLLQFQFPQVAAYSELLIEATARMQALTLEAHATIVQGDRQVKELSLRNDQLRHQAETDGLTDLPNRGQFDAALAQIIETTPEQTGGDEAIALLMIDLDHFKSVNDTHGHPVGDDVLRAVGDVLKQTTRGSDVAARYGGEEFVVLLPAVTVPQLEMIAERLRDFVSKIAVRLPSGDDLRVTASIGGARIGEAGKHETGAQLLARADARLYEAKRTGRNRAVLS
ncbi:MAG: diguanylate cyclase (GGDEF)-like protein [Acidimicrobiales bacterium]|jgi:diguanylate cyclase (GGDEF)-like protein